MWTSLPDQQPLPRRSIRHQLGNLLTAPHQKRERLGELQAPAVEVLFTVDERDAASRFWLRIKP